MLNSKYDIYDLDINNKEGEKILDRFYNHNAKVVKDKYGLLKCIQAIVQFEDNSFGVVPYSGADRNYTIIYDAKYITSTIYETDIRLLLSFNLINKRTINSDAIINHNLSSYTYIDNKIKRVFIEEGYLEF